MGECASRIPPSELIPGEIRVAQAAWRVFLVHDAPINSGMRRAQPVRDNLQLHADGSNLAPFPCHIRERHPGNYREIVETVRLTAPYIDDFPYREEPGERVELEWL